jgi:hypothetical protein
LSESIEQCSKAEQKVSVTSTICLYLLFDLCFFLMPLSFAPVNRTVIRWPYKGVVTRWSSEHEEVKHTNIFMGDLQKALSIMLGDKGCDSKLPEASSGDTMKFMFSPMDQMIL